jgi:hypothetical protein
MKRLVGLTIVLLVLFSSIAQAQQKPKPKPVAVNVVDFAQTELTRKIRIERKNQALTVTLDTTAPYPISNNAKGVRGTGTILTPKTGKQEMFAYDVQINTLKATPQRVSYRLMKGAVTTSDDSVMEYRVKMAQSAIRNKIQHKEGKKLIVSFKSANPVPLTAHTTQIKGEGGFGDGKFSKKFQYIATIDDAKGRIRGARYEIMPDQKVKR